MKKAFADHVLQPAAGNNADALAYRIVKPGTNVYSAYISEVANRLCITGDVCLGSTRYGIVSAPGYNMGWFTGHLSEGYLCEKFLDQEWQWEAAVEFIQWQIKEASEEWWVENTDKLRQFIKDPGWKYDVPTWVEFHEFMTEELEHDGCELPGHDYPRGDAGWLCAIQQRYSELWVKQNE